MELRTKTASAGACSSTVPSGTVWALGRLTIRTALLLGFAAVFALWLASAAYLSGRLADIEALSATTHARQEQAQELLFTVRTQVLLGSVYLRDALDETDASTMRFYRQELHAIREDVRQALEQYLPNVDLPAEREHWSRLEAELRDYWNTMLPVLAEDPTRTVAISQAFLRTQVVPKRDVILAISERIRALHDEGFRQERQQVDLLYRDARRRVWAMNAVAVVLGLGIAAVAARYAGRLEARIQHQHAEVLENRRELQQLSARLVRVQEDERRTIARELHDEIGQVLTAIDVELAIAQRHNEQTLGKTAQSLVEARSMTERAIQTVQDLSELLHPAMLDDFGLPETLTWYLRRFSERTGIRTNLVQEGMKARLSSELEVCTYRIIQEALTNVVRHAQATSCRIFLQRLPYSLLLTVEDDGKGFDPRHAPKEGRQGFGLLGIRERVTEFRGTLRLESSRGKGTRLTIELPVAASERESQTAEMKVGSPHAPEGELTDG